MKIKKLRLKNLNSLVGEWQIDFEHEAFTSSGIFAITGHTGAGKTTLLDAICLALYGRTPRIDALSKSTNEIMSSQAADCYAEVEIETRKGIFRCHWAQSRKKKGKLAELNEAKHEIHDLTSGLIIETKLKATKAKIEEVTGMDFHQFTRSVMLAQGQFSAFLQSDPRERSAILEKITGTKIYSIISQEVHERTKLSVMKFEMGKKECAAIELMSSETEQLFEDEIQKHSAQIRDTEREIESIQMTLKWVQGIENLKTELAQLELQQQHLKEKLPGIEVNRSKIYSARRAQMLMPVHAGTQKLKEKIIKTTESIIKKNSEIAENKSNLESAKIVLQEANSKIAKIEKIIADTLPLAQKTRVIDQHITSQKIEAQKIKERLENTKASISNQEGRINLISGQIETLKQKISEIILTQNSNLGEFELHAKAQMIQDKFSTYKNISAQAGLLTKNLDTLKLDIEKTLHNLKTQEQHHKTAEQQFSLAKKAKETLIFRHNEQLNGKSLHDFQRERNNLLLEAAKTARISNLSALRAELIDEHPCPLCGAEHHPFAHSDPLKQIPSKEKIDTLTHLIENIELTEQDIKNADEILNQEYFKVSESHLKISQMTSKLTILSESLAQNQLMSDHFDSQIQALSQEIGALFKDCNIIYKGHDHIQESLANLLSKIHQIQESSRKMETLEKQLLELSNEVLSLRSSLSEKNESSSLDRVELQEKLELIAKFTSERISLFGNQDPDQVLDSHQSDLKLAHLFESESKIRFLDIETRLAEISAVITVLLENKAAEEIELNRLNLELDEMLLRYGFRDEAELLNSHLPPLELDELETVVKSFERDELRVITLVQEKQRVLAEENAKSSSCESISELNHRLSKAQVEQSSAQTKCAELRALLQKNAQNKITHQEKIHQLALIEKETERWRKLDALIGSKDGRKFRDFAQQITFEMMIAFANQQLAQMSDRYLLLPDPQQELGLIVQDGYQANILRSVKNLSGGECFLASLSLALGLSKMASRSVRVDSLFLDEGFGTLDEDTLNTAIESLANLQHSGKTVGLISHISIVKERITTQIEVSSITPGKSKISGPGCQRLS